MGDKKKKKGKLSGRTKILLVLLIIVVVAPVAAYTVTRGVLPFEGDRFSDFISFRWVTGK